MRNAILLTIMIMGWLFGPPSNVQKANESYHSGKFKEAEALYAGEFGNYNGQQAKLDFNVAQCWLFQDSSAQALSWYGKATNLHQEDRLAASWAWNQIGAIYATGKDPASQHPQQMAPGSLPGAANLPSTANHGPGGPMQGNPVTREKLEQSLVAFKDALKLDNDNEIARYNYELIKRKLQQQEQNQDPQQDQKQEQQQDQQQQDQQKQDQQKQDQQKQPENKENQAQNGQNDKKPGEEGEGEAMSPEEAERILSAMNANEKKYLQQIEKRKKHRTYNHDGPDW
jgi:cobalamin biosynthesis protein CobT